jgi:hypothetical protein
MTKPHSHSLMLRPRACSLRAQNPHRCLPRTSDCGCPAKPPSAQRSCTALTTQGAARSTCLPPRRTCTPPRRLPRRLALRAARARRARSPRRPPPPERGPPLAAAAAAGARTASYRLGTCRTLPPHRRAHVGLRPLPQGQRRRAGLTAPGARVRGRRARRRCGGPRPPALPRRSRPPRPRAAAGWRRPPPRQAARRAQCQLAAAAAPRVDGPRRQRGLLPARPRRRQRRARQNRRRPRRQRPR